MTEPAVFLVAYMDGAWDDYDPLSPAIGCPAAVADEPVIVENLRIALDLMAEHVEGKFVFGAHTGVYCRELFYQDPLLSLYRTLIERGGELAVHPHEEVIGETTLVNSTRHMRKVILEKAAQLSDAGVPATTYRGGYGAFAAGLTPILEEAGVHVELSATPGRENRLWNACWEKASPSAYYLCTQDPFHGDCDHRRSSVLEIPIGWDGVGTELSESYLWNEIADLDSMKRTWDAVLARHDKTGEAQFVHALSHLFSMGHEELRDRWTGFLQHVVANGARVVKPSEAHAEFDRIRPRAATVESGA